MTTDNAEQQNQVVDELSQDQKGLDTEQAAEGAPQFVTMEMFEAEKARNAKLEGDLRGLQGKQDRALNAIRRDSEAQVRQRATEVEIQNLPEESQPHARRQAEQMEALHKSLADTQQSATTDADGGSQDAGARMSNYLKGKGFDPNDPRVTRLIPLADGSQEGAESFVYQLGQLSGRGATAYGVPASVAAAGPAPSADATPGRGQAVETEDEIRDAYITGKIDLQTRDDKYRGIGAAPPG